MIRDFKKHFHLADKFVRKELSKYQMSMSLKSEGKKARLGFSMPPKDKLGRLALLAQPFADSESNLFIQRLITAIPAEIPGKIADDRLVEYQQAVDAICRGSIPLVINKNRLDGPKIFRLYAYGGYIKERSLEKQELQQILRIPSAKQQMEFGFFSYCLGSIQLCQALYSDIQASGADAKPSPAKASHRTEQCIYCRTTSGDFSTQEHVYPESLGNTKIILPPGMVCKRCNNEVLSALDEELVNHDFIAFLRVIFMPINPKTGKYPAARTGTFGIKKVGPNDIQVDMHGVSKSAFKKLPKEGGSFKLNIKGRKPFDPVQFGRSLYKVGLGIVAYHQGAEACLHTKYDPARDFVLGKADFPNHFLMRDKITPSQSCGAKYNAGLPGTIMIINIFGIDFIINLEPLPKLSPLPPEWEKNLRAFPLFNGT